MQISSYRPTMRTGASSVAFNNKPDLQTLQAQAAQNSKNVTISDNAAQKTRSQQEAQLLNVGLSIDFTA